MEVNPVSYMEIILSNTEDENEIEQFMNLMRKVYIESSKAGLVNMFEEDKSIIKKLVEKLTIKIETQDIKPIIPNS